MKNIPVIVPTSDDVKPCEGHSELFSSPLIADHAQARIHCKGNRKLGVPPCPFIGWCVQEREAFQTTEYAVGLHGTWHGDLFVDGKFSRKGKRPVGRPRKEEGVA